jgi:hypothetical protein
VDLIIILLVLLFLFSSGGGYYYGRPFYGAGLGLVLLIILLLVLLGRVHAAQAAGQYPDGRLHAWFDTLASGKGLCCSFADGRTLSDPEWGTHGDHYWVIIDRIRYAVPADAVVAVPNVFGRAVVWPYMDEQDQTLIRCFMPGGGA